MYKDKTEENHRGEHNLKLLSYDGGNMNIHHHALGAGDVFSVHAVTIYFSLAHRQSTLGIFDMYVNMETNSIFNSPILHIVCAFRYLHKKTCVCKLCVLANDVCSSAVAMCTARQQTAVPQYRPLDY